MNTLEAIAQRRSIRRFKHESIPEETLRAIINAGIQAPSGKNRQPWRFVIVNEDQRPEMARILREGIEKTKADGEDPGSSEYSARIMERAPVTVFVFNPDGLSPSGTLAGLKNECMGRSSTLPRILHLLCCRARVIILLNVNDERSDSSSDR